MDPACLGATIDVLGEIQRVFGGPDNMAFLLISPMDLSIKQLS
jgi:hypothetical protein